MKTLVILISLSIGLVACSTITKRFSAVYYVSFSDGLDDNPGTLQEPFKTIQHAVQHLEPGDTCYVMDGFYKEVVSLDELKGVRHAPIVISAVPGHKPVIDGTLDIIGGWQLHEGHIYKKVLDRDMWGLYYQDSLMMAARWPNAAIYDHNFFNQKETYRDMSGESSLGKVYDSRPVNDWKGWYELPEDGSFGIIREGRNTQSLAETGTSMEGAVAILNIGNWWTWASDIMKHEVGSNYFEYDSMFSASGTRRSRALQWTRPWWQQQTPEKKALVNKLTQRIRNRQCHYYIEGFPCLDAPGEWWYDRHDKILYFYPPRGEDPNSNLVKAKVRDYSLTGNSSSYVEIRGIDFYGTAFKLDNCNNITLEDCDFLFPGHSRLVLGDYDKVNICTFNNSGRSENRIINCTFQYFDGDGIYINGGSHNLVENCLFTNYNYTCLGDGKAMRLGNIDTDITDLAKDEVLALNNYDTVRYVTVYNEGGSEGICLGGGSVAEYLHLHHYGNLQHDGAGLQIGVFDGGTIYRYNWSHNCLKNSYRFDDGGGLPNPPPLHGQINHNVGWTSLGYQVKGDNHLINNNLSFNTFKGIEVMIHERMNGINKNTITINNLVDRIISFRGLKDPPPGYLGSNISVPTDSVKSMLRDPDNWDFRPKIKTLVADKGEEYHVCGTGDSPTGYCFRYDRPILKLGKLPDIGPYEYGAENYWIPGYRYPHASTPIPFDNSETKVEKVDLMWLEGYKASSYDVYFGDSVTAVAAAGHDSPEYKGNLTNNIFYPGKLVSGRTYYWRIDAISDQRVVKGEVWSFTAKKDANVHQL